MLAAGHPAVAVLLGLGAAGLGALVVVMAWNIHVRQFRLAELLARRQFTGTKDSAPGRVRGERGRRRGGRPPGGGRSR